MPYVTVGDLVTEARVLLQDTQSDNYRWSDDMVYQALNEGLLETKKLRPDFYRGLAATPQYAPTDVNTAITYPEEYRPALTNFIVGRIFQQDDEAADDDRAGKFLGAGFLAKLTQAIA